MRRFEETMSKECTNKSISEDTHGGSKVDMSPIAPSLDARQDGANALGVDMEAFRSMMTNFSGHAAGGLQEVDAQSAMDASMMAQAGSMCKQGVCIGISMDAFGVV